VKVQYNLCYETAFLSNNFIHRAGTFARSLVPVRYPALLATKCFKSDSSVVVGKNSFSMKQASTVFQV
jgi:hypothetical protein